MRRRKLLITAIAMNIGGAEKSLANFLNLLDYHSYNVDLLLFQRRGDFLKQIPEEVNLISVPEIDVLYGIEPRDQIAYPKRIALTAIRYLATGIVWLCEKEFCCRRLARWKHFYSKLIPRLRGSYDFALAYVSGEAFWYVIDKVESDSKAVIFHNDYSNIEININGELRYLEQADHIATVSDICADSLCSLFPSQTTKISVVQNPTCARIAHRLGTEVVADGFSANEDVLRVISVGRLEEQKGFDMAVKAAEILKREIGFCFEWLVVGDGSQRSFLQELVDCSGVGDVFRLVGAKTNPYPYLASADVLVQPSRYEGKSVVVDEARVFGLPVLSTNYSSARDQVRDELDGVIVPMNPEGIARGIERLVKDRDFLCRLSEGAKAFDTASLEDISGFLRLIGEDASSRLDD